MSVSRTVMLPFRYSRVSLLSHSKSTLAFHRKTTVLNVPNAQATSSSSVVHFMGTWTDRIKMRWQSGNQSEESSKKSKVCYEHVLIHVTKNSRTFVRLWDVNIQ